MTDLAEEYDPRALSLEAFLGAIDRVAWLSNLGQPHPADGEVVRIHDPKDWVGPEHLGGASLGEEMNRWQVALMAQSRPGRSVLDPLSERIHEQVVEKARARVDYDPEDDSWVWSYAAVQQAAFIGAVIGCSLRAARPLPANLLRQWAWYVRGHWPCSYRTEDILVENFAIVESSLDKARLVVL